MLRKNPFFSQQKRFLTAKCGVPVTLLCIERYMHTHNAITAKTPQKGQPNSRSAEKYTTLFETDCTTVAFFHLITGRQITTCTPVRQPTAFCNLFSGSNVKRTTLVKHENDCSAVGKCETYFPDKLLSHYFTQQTLHFNFTDTLTPSPVRYSCVR